MDNKQIHNEPSDVQADAGSVTVEGPDGVDVALTPEAAEETSDRLWVSATQARAQQRHEIDGGDPKNGDEDL
jgi:hypothetical protein